MFDNRFDFTKFPIDREIDKLRQIVQINKKFIIKNSPIDGFYGIKNFWIITHSGITLFSLENSLFPEQSEKDLFGGFITAVISLSEVLTKGKLTEIKIDNHTMYIQNFSSYFIVSIIEWNSDLSLKFLEKLSLHYKSEIEGIITSSRIVVLKSFSSKYFQLLNDNILKKHIIFELAVEYLSKFIFGILELELLYQKISSLLIYLSSSEYHEFLDSQYLYLAKLKSTNVNSERIKHVTMVLDAIHSHIQYSNNKTEENYVNFLKNIFVLFLEFINQTPEKLQ